MTRPPMQRSQDQTNVCYLHHFTKRMYVSFSHANVLGQCNLCLLCLLQFVFIMFITICVFYVYYNLCLLCLLQFVFIMFITIAVKAD